MRKFLLIILILFGAFVFVGCGEEEENADIYTSIYPIEFIVKEIVEDRYTVKSIYPRGKDVHDYEPNPKDILRMSQGKLIFYIGLGLEMIVEESLKSTLKNIPSIPLSDNLELVPLNSDSVNDGHNQAHAFYDPHVWLDPFKMQIMTQTVLESLVEYLEPTEEETSFFTENANSLKEKLNDLDKEFFQVVNNPQLANKTIIVDHDAYIYWEQRYGIKRIRLRNDNESPDIIPEEMRKKIELAKELGIQYICTTKNELESSIIPQYLKELGLTAENKVQLHHLATITYEEEENGLDYFSIMRININTLSKVLPKK